MSPLGIANGGSGSCGNAGIVAVGGAVVVGAVGGAEPGDASAGPVGRDGALGLPTTGAAGRARYGWSSGTSTSLVDGGSGAALLGRGPGSGGSALSSNTDGFNDAQTPPDARASTMSPSTTHGHARRRLLGEPVATAVGANASPGDAGIDAVFVFAGGGAARARGSVRKPGAARSSGGTVSGTGAEGLSPCPPPTGAARGACAYCRSSARAALALGGRSSGFGATSRSTRDASPAGTPGFRVASL